MPPAARQRGRHSAVDTSVLVVAGYAPGSRWTRIGECSDLVDLAVDGALAVTVGVVVRRRLRARRS